MIKQITTNEAKKLIEINEKVLLVFSSKWCGRCKINKFIWEKVFPQYEDQIKFANIDIDKQDNWAAESNDFEINVFPTIIGYRNGKQIFVQKNFTAEVKLKELLDKL